MLKKSSKFGSVYGKPITDLCRQKIMEIKIKKDLVILVYLQSGKLSIDTRQILLLIYRNFLQTNSLDYIAYKFQPSVYQTVFDCYHLIFSMVSLDEYPLVFLLKSYPSYYLSGCLDKDDLDYSKHDCRIYAEHSCPQEFHCEKSSKLIYEIYIAFYQQEMLHNHLFLFPQSIPSTFLRCNNFSKNLGQSLIRIFLIEFVLKSPYQSASHALGLSPDVTRVAGFSDDYTKYVDMVLKTKKYPWIYCGNPVEKITNLADNISCNRNIIENSKDIHRYYKFYPQGVDKAVDRFKYLLYLYFLLFKESIHRESIHSIHRPY
jgi:hypothetical protein